MSFQNEVIGHTEHPQEFEGSWEKAGRSPVSAAILGFVIVGAVYAYAQIFIGFAALIIQNSGTETYTAHAKTMVDLLTSRALASKNPLRFSIIIAEFVFMLFPTIWLVRRWHTRDFARYVRLKKTTGLEIAIAVLSAFLFFPVSTGISDVLMRQIHFPDFLAKIDSLVFAASTPSELVWVIVVVCVTPAICEETLFRGYLQRTLERTIGVKSIFVAGILFGLYHMRPLNLVPLSILGIMIGFFAYRSRSLVPGMAAHFTNNLIAVLSVYRLPEGNTRLLSATLHFPWFIFILGCVGTGTLVVLYKRITDRNFTAGTEYTPDSAGSLD